VEAQKGRLSDLEKEERDLVVIKTREKMYEKYGKHIEAQRELIQELREGHKNVGQVYKGMFGVPPQGLPK
jgi:hypothetical protein